MIEMYLRTFITKTLFTLVLRIFIGVLSLATELFAIFAKQHVMIRFKISH